jgi:4-hydroxyacetophenone monooxygenase
MLSYVTKVAENYRINEHIQTNKNWVSSTWLDDRKIWTVEFQDTISGEIIIQECKVLIAAIGHQVDPKPFEVPGKALFQGRIIHASRWPQGVNLIDKNTVVLGNGSTLYTFPTRTLEAD